MTGQQIAELLSIGLTVPTITLAIFVCGLWGPMAARVAMSGHPKNATEWFVIGVAIGFLGAALDNAFWQVAWCCDFLEVKNSDKIFQMGVYFNIVSRQGLGIAAAYCHIKSYAEHEEAEGHMMGWLNIACIGSVILGCINSLTLWLLMS